MSEDFKSRAKKWPKGNHYEDFELGHVYHHHWGRTLNDGDNSLFSTLTLSFNPLYFNAEYAAAHGQSRPESGIVSWHTEGHNSRGELVIDFLRTNLVSKRNPRP
jgi:acyl dehydratase